MWKVNEDGYLPPLTITEKYVSYSISFSGNEHTTALGDVGWSFSLFAALGYKYESSMHKKN